MARTTTAAAAEASRVGGGAAEEEVDRRRSGAPQLFSSHPPRTGAAAATAAVASSSSALTAPWGAAAATLPTAAAAAKSSSPPRFTSPPSAERPGRERGTGGSATNSATRGRKKDGRRRAGVYLGPDRRVAPYLRVPVTVTTASSTTATSSAGGPANTSTPSAAGHPQEADAAAGGSGASGALLAAEHGDAAGSTSFLVRRVASSLHLLSPQPQRVASVPGGMGGSAGAQGPATPGTIYGPRSRMVGHGRPDDESYPTWDVDSDDVPPAIPSWRLKGRMKTAGIGLVLALNIGTDPPDLIKPGKCAVLEAWMDPHSVSRSKAREMIGERLEAQYGRWQLSRGAGRPLKFRRVADPTVDDVKNLCWNLRRQAKNERILFHYNGRGVPRPTDNGEIWVFDKNHTEYIPFTIAELRSWLGKPSMVVLDCSSSGVLLPFFAQPLEDVVPDPALASTQGAAADEQDDDDFNDAPPAEQGNRAAPRQPNAFGSGRGGDGADMEEVASRIVNDTIVLAPCAAHEWLPVGPDYPADIFTACLTTPIQMALRWFVSVHESTSMRRIDRDSVDYIPGKANDRKTLLGELNWIFTAVTDSIAWNSLPRPLFQRLFRQDLLVASMFRNFLLADRILRSLNCTPVSHPPLPPGMSSHPLWRAWDVACESLLCQLKSAVLIPRSKTLENAAVLAAAAAAAAAASAGRNADDPSREENATDAESGRSSVGPSPRPTLPGRASLLDSDPQLEQLLLPSSPFFSEQLTAFEVWLEFAEVHRVGLEPPEQLPVLLQVLLSQVHRIRALELLKRFLRLGPWAVNMGLSLGIFPYVMKLLQSQEYKSLLVAIWASIVSFDPSTRVDLLKDGVYHHFAHHLLYGLQVSGGVGSEIDVVIDDTAVSKGGGSGATFSIEEAAKERTMAAFVLAAAAHEYPAGQAECVKLQLHVNCCVLLNAYEQGGAVLDPAIEPRFPPHLRMWLLICIGNVVKENPPIQNEAMAVGVHVRVLARTLDHDSHVRAAACYALGCIIGQSQKNASRSASTQDLSSASQASHAFQQSPGPAPFGFTSPGQHQFQSPFAQGASAPGGLAPGPQWRPQYVDRSGRPIAGGFEAGSSASRLQPTYQPIQVQQRPGHPQGVPAEYMLQQPLYLSPTHRGGPIPIDDLRMLNMGGQPMVVVPQSQQYQLNYSHESPIRHVKPTVYEDRLRLSRDLELLDALTTCAKDSSVLVRYEATMGLAAAVGKYLDAFIVAADESASSSSIAVVSDRPQRAYPLPRGFDRQMAPQFANTWTTLRQLQHDDPFPKVSKAASQIVSFVHEHLLQYRMETEISLDERLESASEVDDGAIAVSSVTGIPRTPIGSRTAGGGRAVTTGRLRSSQELRRVSSEVATRDDSLFAAPTTSGTGSGEQAGTGTASAEPHHPWSFELPKSSFYTWKKRSFDPTFSLDPEEILDLDELDMLSPVGAARAYQERRNLSMYKAGLNVSSRFACLAPKPSKPKRRTIGTFIDEEGGDEAAEAALEEQVAAKKLELKMNEKLILTSDVKMTSMLHFHSFEPLLISCGGRGTVTLWDTDGPSSKRLAAFDVGNPESSRMTTSGWICEESASLFYVGCDDGSVRIFSGLVAETGGRRHPPLADRSVLLRSAFTAVPMKAGERGTSGLVSEWQPQTGLLLAGGNAAVINAIDLESESRVCELPTGTDAYVTTLTTAWDTDPVGSASASSHGLTSWGGGSNQGIGPHVLVSGHSDGSMKIFDLRAHGGHQLELLESDVPVPRRTRHSRVVGYSEHTSWIVTTAFTAYSGRPELISGTLAGKVKSWDLRMSSSIRTIEVQRSPMTALAVHAKIPLLASGSHAQFIKLLTPDGDPLQVLRYHEKMAANQQHRIGPVSCLAFHRYKAVLAAGSTDTHIGLFAP